MLLGYVVLIFCMCCYVAHEVPNIYPLVKGYSSTLPRGVKHEKQRWWRAIGASHSGILNYSDKFEKNHQANIHVNKN